MPDDICRCPVTLKSPAALTAWNGMTHAFITHGKATPEHLGAVLDQAPDFAMGHAARGLFSLMMGRAELVAVADTAAQAARYAAASSDVTPREAGWVAALDAWLSGSTTGAIRALETVLAAYPADSLTAKVSHGLHFILGDAAGMRASIERILPAHDQDHPMRGYMLGCHAFTLEETGDYAGAEAAGRDGLSQTVDDAWGLHAVAHVYDMTARSTDGIALIEANSRAWDRSNNFRYHVWWHKALLHLDRTEYDVALDVYDTQIRSEKTDDYRDIANATSLLMRLELEGIDVGQRWEELADLAQNRTGDGCLVFADLHYMLALSGAKRPDARAAMLTRFERDAARGGETNRCTAHPGGAALSGLNAFAEGRYGMAFDSLCAARPAMQTIGGSHAQRDVFERMTIDAGLRAGRSDAVERLLYDRIARRAGTEDTFSATRLGRIQRARRIPAQ